MSRFLGRESLGPEHVSPAVPGDSPRHHGNRNDGSGARADRVLARLSARLVRDASGHTFERAGHLPTKGDMTEAGPTSKPSTHSFWRIPGGWRGACVVAPQVTRIANSVPAKTLLAKGWVALGPDLGQPMPDIDERIALVDPFTGEPTGETMSERERLHGDLAHQAHELRVGEHYTGRRFYDGGEIVRPTENDRDMAPAHADRIGSKALDINEAKKPKP